MIAFSLTNLLETAEEIEIISGTPLSSDTGVEALYDGWPGSALMILENDLEFIARWASAVFPLFVSAFHTTLLTAISVKGDSAENWATPAHSFTIAAPSYRVGNLSTAPFITPAAGAPQTAWQFKIDTNTRAITMGELFFGQEYETVEAALQLDGHADELIGEVFAHPTYHGARLKSERHTPRHSISGVAFADSATEIQKLEDILHTIRLGARPFGFVKSRNTSSAWFAELVASRINRPRVGSITRRYDRLVIEEVSRGLRWIE